MARKRWRECTVVGVDVKICGLTRAEDAALAARHGAWRLGVVFAGGPRSIDVEQARDIVAASGGVPVLGVFGRQQTAEIVTIARAAGLAGAQLHGDYAAADAQTLTAAGLEVWRVLPLDQHTQIADAVAAASTGAAAVLIEPRHADGRGGKGVPLSLDLAVAARRAVTGRLVLAGGLVPENVTATIELVGPDAVDVSSGVEMAPGIKDPARLVRFLENARAARTSR